MAVQSIITVTHRNETIGTIKGKVQPNSTTKELCVNIRNLFLAFLAQTRSASIQTTVTSGDQAAATGTVTFTGSNTANDTFLINGVTMTCVSSGATNNQWNVGGGTATQQAAAFVAAVNASTTSLISGHVTASNVAGVVTLTSNFSSVAGNAVTIAKGTDSGSVMTVSGARLTGGANPVTSTSATYHAGV